jgi:hypothetical protein
MILFDLLCSSDHRFEGWFKSGATFDSQIGAGEVVCPVCGDTAIHKALSAPALLRTSGRSENIAIKMREALTELRKHVTEHCDYVGDRFPEEARSIHYGEKKDRPIYGEATPDEARELSEEGVEIVAIPWLSPQDS